MTTHNENESVVRNSRLEAITTRVEAPSESWFAETKDQVIEDRKFLLQFVREQAAQLKAVRRLADESVHRISPEDLVAALEQTVEESTD